MVKSHRKKNSKPHLQVDGAATKGNSLGMFRECFYSQVCTLSMHRQLNIAAIKYKTSLLTVNKATHSPLSAGFRRQPSNATSLAQGHFVAFRLTKYGSKFLMLSFVIAVPRCHWRMGSVKIKVRCLNCGSTLENGTLLLSLKDFRATYVSGLFHCSKNGSIASRSIH